jgi:hypothetical protein
VFVLFAIVHSECGRSSTNRSRTGRLPAFNASAISDACSSVNEPVISPRLAIVLWIDGAEYSFPSRMMPRRNRLELCGIRTTAWRRCARLQNLHVRLLPGLERDVAELDPLEGAGL